VGTSGRILHFDGASWSPMTGGPGPTLRGVWGSGSADVFAVGDGLIAHWDGSAWSVVTPPAPSPMPVLFDVWGTGPADVWVAGEGGTLLWYDGSAWTVVPSGTTETLRALWGSASNDVYAVGDNGTILHFDGTSWTSETPPSSERLDGVWGSSGSDVFAVGGAGTILHSDGAVWTAMDCRIAALPPSPRPLATRILNVPAFRAFYEDRLRWLLAGPFSETSMHAEIDAQYQFIRSSVYSDPQKEMSDQDFDDSIHQDLPLTGPNRILGLKPFVTRRIASVQNQLP